MNYDKILQVTESTVTSPSFYWQSLILIICFVAAYFCYKLSRKFFFVGVLSRNLQRDSNANRLITRYALPMLYPALASLFLTIGMSIYGNFSKEVVVLSATAKLVFLFLFLRFLRISSNSKLVTNITGFFLMPILILDIFGLLESTIIYLDEFAFKIGTLRISVYLVIKAIVVLAALFWLSSLIRTKSKYYIDSRKSIKTSTKGIISKVIDIFIYSVVFIILLKTFGVDLTTLAVIGGAIGVGIGFGLQKIASNFISGIILLFEKSVEIGDIVELDNGNIFGTVKHFGGRYTLVESMDGKEIMIPNEEFIINKVTNWTYSNNRARIEIIVGVAHGTDLERACDLMVESAKENPRCLNYPEIECYVTNFGEYDIKITLYFWISDIVSGRMKPRSEVYMAIWKRFKENGIKVPVPQRELINR
jgi:small-conductance mechanosensitive channel